MSGPPTTGDIELSVVLPLRDVEGTLDEAVGSVLADRDVRLELLLIDDHSADASPELARARAATDVRVRVLPSDGHGLVAALSTGLRASRARFVARMDGDDVSLPGRFRAQLDALRVDASLAAVGGMVEAISDDAPVGAGMARYVAWMNDLRTPADHARDALVEAPLCHPSVMLRRAALDAVGGYRDGAFAEDWDLWLRLIETGWSLAKVECPVLRWRHRAGRATFTDPRYSPERHRALRAMHLAPRLARERALGRAIAVWGAGPTGRRLVRALEPHGIRADRFVDIDPKKIGRTARGAPIVAASALAASDFVVVAVGSAAARGLVRAELVRVGRVELTDFVCAA